jgi:UDP-N-acetylglucosamine:LPS N-acetylglucosamine transferase
MKKTKVLFISSTGGHLSEMFQLKDMFKDYDYHIITEKTKNNLSLKNKYHDRISFLLYGTKHYMLSYPFIALINCILSLIFYIKYKPKYIITT